MTLNPETAALLEILKRGERQVAEGRVHHTAEVIAQMRRRLKRYDASASSKGPGQ